MARKTMRKNKVQSFGAFGSMLIVCISLGISYSAWNQESEIEAQIFMNHVIPKVEAVQELGVGTYMVKIIPYDLKNNKEVDKFVVPIQCTKCEVFLGQQHIVDIDSMWTINAGDKEKEMQMVMPLQQIGETLNQEGEVGLTLNFEYTQSLPEEDQGSGWKYVLEENIEVELPVRLKNYSQVQLHIDENVPTDVQNSQSQQTVETTH